MSRVLIRSIAVLEIIGGVSGPLLVIWALAVSPLNLITLVISIFPLCIFMLSVVAGVGLWRGTPFGRNASILIQAIQIPKIISPLMIFVVSVGVDLWIHIVVSELFSNVGFEFKVLAFYQIFFAVPQAPYGLGISVTSCIFLVVLIKYRPGQVVTSDDPLSPPPLPANEWSGAPGPPAETSASMAESKPNVE
jgi:hypothetical protein